MIPSKRKPYRLLPLSECITYKLYEAHINDDENDKHSLDQICRMLNNQVSRKLITSALNIACKTDVSYFERSDANVRRHGRSNDYRYSITSSGILSVERSIRIGNTIAAYMNSSENYTLDELAGFGSSFISPREILDKDYWKPLDIDRTTETYKEVIQVLEDCFEVIRGDNGLAAERPAERRGLIASLEQGIDQLKNRLPSVQMIRSLIISPLQWVMSNFANKLIGEAAKKAVDKLWHFLSIGT